MKHRVVIFMMAVLVAALLVPAAYGQGTTTVKGVCKDRDGKPFANAQVVFYSAETGRKYNLKTNNKGEYFSLGVASGKYKVTLLQDGKEIYSLNGVPVTLSQDENVIDVDLKKEAGAQQQGISEEQKKAMQEQQEKAQKEQLTVKSLNDKLAGARAAMQASNFDQAAQLMSDASQIDPTRDLIWFTLGDAYRGKAKSVEKTDRAAAKESYDQAITAYEKAIALKPSAAYYNNVAEVYGKAGRMDDAIKAYNQAATLDPPGAGMYYFNLGAVLTNSGRVDDAIEAFKKTVAADPTKADAYYWMGVNLVGKATLDKSGKVIPVEGTADAFNKYLELQPTGNYAQAAKDMLTSIGSTIETSFGTKKKPATKK
jgi:tetratricopeptide (TPR) repeat protein